MSTVSGPLCCKHNALMDTDVGKMLLCGLLTCISLAHAADRILYEGDSCDLPNGEVGLCTKDRSCPIITINLKKGISPIICSFQGLNQTIVCCPPVGTPSIDGRFDESQEHLSPNAMVTMMCERYAAIASPPSQDPEPGTDSTLEAPSNHQPKRSGSLRRTLGFRIIGGVPAGDDEFPHMAALGFGNADSVQWLCGGTLISERFVLTAAHCLQSRERGLVRWVRLGGPVANETTPYTQKVAVKARHRHDNYTMLSYYHDIALLELQDNVRLSAFVHPACLHTDFVGPEDGACIATGWGAVNTSVAESLQLMKVELPFQELEMCNLSYRTLIKTRKLSAGVLEDTMICVGDPKKDMDTCQGDSGGPIQVQVKSHPHMYSVVGVTSFGMMGCGSSSPAVYTRVSHYIPWITSIVWPADTQS